jgi:3-oxoacyl-[acyl-carrier protein] reductase
MELGIAGKRALVTGASRGIGQACARALAAEGAEVAICARGEADLTEALRELGGVDAGHRALALDLMDPNAPRRLVDWLGNTPDIVVHSLGGTLGVRDALPTAEQWRNVFRLNVEVAAELNAAFLPVMAERGFGRICAISSLAAFEMHGSISYGVAKAALTAYTRGLGRTYADTGVVVTAVVPGVVLTEGGHWDNNRRNDPAYVEQYVRERLPRGMFGTPEEVAAAVVFLCSKNAAPFIGSIVPLEGGQARSFFGQ